MHSLTPYSHTCILSTLYDLASNLYFSLRMFRRSPNTIITWMSWLLSGVLHPLPWSVMRMTTQSLCSQWCRHTRLRQWSWSIMRRKHQRHNECIGFILNRSSDVSWQLIQTSMKTSLIYVYREWQKAMQNWISKPDLNIVTSTPAVRPSISRCHCQNTSFSAIIEPLWCLTMTSISVLVDQFDYTLQQLKLNTLMDNIARFCAKGLNTHHFINIVKRADDQNTDTGLEKMQFLIYDSSKLQYILYQLHTYVLSQSVDGKVQKLLITEDVVPSAWFLKIACRAIYVDTEVLHAGLSNQEQIDLVRWFNDFKNSLTVLIIMYAVSAQGANLNTCCSWVIVTTADINTSVKIQGWGWVIRVCIEHLLSYWYERLTSMICRYLNKTLSWLYSS